MNFKSNQSFSSYSSNSPNNNAQEEFSQFQADVSINQIKVPPISKKNYAQTYQKLHQDGQIRLQRQRRCISNRHCQKMPSYNNSIDCKQFYPKSYCNYLINEKEHSSVLSCLYQNAFSAKYLQQINEVYKERLNRLNLGFSQNSVHYKLSNSISNDHKKSQFWNGKKFDYLKNNNQKTQNRQIKKQKIKGLIISKKNSIPKTEEYIKIQQSNQLSEKKQFQNIQKQKAENQKFIQNQEEIQKFEQKEKPNQEKYIKSHINNAQKQHKQKREQNLIQICNITSQKQKLKRQNEKLKQLLKEKDFQIQKLIRERLYQNDEYIKNIQSLKSIFEKQKMNGISLFQKEIKRINEVHQIQIKKLTSEHAQQILNLSQFKSGLHQKQSTIACYQAKIQQFQYQIKSFLAQVQKLQETLRKTQKELTNQKKQKQAQIQKYKKSAYEKKQEQKQIANQKWKTNFIRVFADMIKKLPQQIKIDKNWTEKKIVVVGWQIIKAIIQKYLKIGIKFPHFVYETEQNLNGLKN